MRRRSSASSWKTRMDAKAEQESHRRTHRPVGGRDRHGGPCPGDRQREAVLRRRDRFRGRAESAGLSRRRRMPGMLPVINGHCIDQAIKTGLGLTPRSTSTAIFDRKNYFYPICRPATRSSQYQQPGGRRGRVIVDLLGGDARQSASTGCILSKTPARACTTSTRSTPMSISTAQAWR